MNVKQLATASAVALIMSSGQLLAAPEVSLNQYLKMIHHDSVVLASAKAGLTTDQNLLSKDTTTEAIILANKTTADTVLATALAQQTADQAQLALDVANEKNFAANQAAKLAADAAAVVALQRIVNQDKANHVSKATYQHDLTLLNAAKAAHQADILAPKSGLAAIDADHGKLNADSVIVGHANQADTIATTQYNSETGVLAHDQSVESQQAALVASDLAQYNQDFAACTAAYSASAC